MWDVGDRPINLALKLSPLSAVELSPGNIGNRDTLIEIADKLSGHIEGCGGNSPHGLLSAV